MPLNTQPFEVRSFLGGLTDHQNTDATNTYLSMDNLLFDGDGEVFTRYGSVVYNGTRLPSGNQRVSKIVNFQNDGNLIILSGSHAFYDNSGTWTEIHSPSGGDAIPSASSSSNFQVNEWKKHLIISSDSQIQPVKIFRDDNNGWMSITAGLPKPTTDCPGPFISSAGILSACISLANEVRTTLIAHFAEADPHSYSGSSGDTTSGAGITAAATDLPSLITLIASLLTAYTLHYNDAWSIGNYHRKNQTITYGFSAQSDETLFSVSPPVDLASCVEKTNDLRIRLNTHAGHIGHHYRFPVNFVTTNQVGMYKWTGPVAILDVGYIWYYVNLFKSNMNSHFDSGGTSASAHSTAKDLSDQISTPDATSPDTLKQLINDLRIAYTSHETDAELSSAWSYHIAQISPNQRINPSSALVYKNTYSSAPYPDEWYGLQGENIQGVMDFMNDWRTIFNGHINDWVAHYTTKPTSGGSTTANSYDINTIPGTATFASATYNYAIVYKYSYVIDGVTFEMRGEPLYFETQGIPGISTGVIPIEQQGLQIGNIPPLVNDGTTAYDVSNVVIEIYRTISTGSDYFLSGTIQNTGTTALTYTDTMKDSDLVNQQGLYTEGGVNPNSLPPKAKFNIITGDFSYYANFSGGSNRVVQSQPSIIDGVYGGNFVDLPFEVAGLADFRGIPISWTANQIYRLEGNFDEQGNGSISAVPIATNIGLSGSFSPIVYDNGIVFAAQDGFYLTDGYRVQKINTYWRDTYLNLIRTSTYSSQMHGVYERNNRRLWWVTNTNSSDNDSCYVLDANFPITPNSVFTSINAEAQSANFAPSAIGYYKGQIIRGDSRGYVFKHDPSYLSDPKVDTGTSPGSWTTSWITYSYQSPYYDFGSISQRKWNPRVNAKIRNNGNLSLQINLFTDNATTEKSSMSPLYYRGTNDVIEQRGHVPSGYLRCRNRSIQMTNAFVVIQNSDTYGVATLNMSAKTLTLGSSWSGDLVDQYVTFPGDNYTTQWLITAQSGTVLTLSDPGGTLPSSGSTKWEIKGYPKDEKFQLVSYALQVAMLGRNQPVIGTSTGGNS